MADTANITRGKEKKKKYMPLVVEIIINQKKKVSYILLSVKRTDLNVTVDPISSWS